MTLLAYLACATHARGQDADAILFDSLWTVTLADAAAAAAAVDDTRAFVPLRNGQLTARLLLDGAEAWSVSSPTTFAPAAGDGRTFVVDGADVRALDADSGAPVWHVTLGEDATLAPTFDTGWLFVGTARRVVALRALDGTQIWSLDLEANLSAPPAPAADRLYLSVSDGRVVAVDLHSGAIVWERTLPAPPSEILPLDDRLFVGSANNYFYCLSIQDGGERWTWRTGGDIVGTPVVDEARVYFMSRDSQLRAHDRGSGNQRWSQSAPGRMVGGPIRSEGFIVLASLTPRLHVYQRADGRPAGGSPEPTGDALQSALIAPPSRVRVNRRDAFLLLTRQGELELFVYAEPDDEDEAEAEDAAETLP